MSPKRAFFTALVLLAGSRASSEPAGEAASPWPSPPPDGGERPGFVVAFREDFEALSLGSPAWQEDPYPDDGPYSDNSSFFTDRGITPPLAFRSSLPFGAGNWLTVDSYSRSQPAFSELLSVVPDPSGAPNRVLRLASPEHTDATTIRPTAPLPERYRISLRVGYADFGDGEGGLNGYDGGETAEPWLDQSSTEQNGFYWLSILDTPPRPHNNVWIHHHRKVVIDSDSHSPPWVEIFNGEEFVESGKHPVMMFALDGQGETDKITGKPFLSYSDETWQPSGKIRAVDAYQPDTWYRVSIEHNEGRFTLEVSGDFQVVVNS